MKVSARSQVPPFAVMDIIAEANRRKAAGESIINLCAGEPATGASDVVRERAIELLSTENLGYTEALGVPALRQEIAAHYKRWYDVDVDPSQVAITTGSSGGFVLAFLAAFDPGDRVALARPGYPAYKNILVSLGIEVVELNCGPETRYQPTISQLQEAYYNGGLDGLIVASPANPTGTMLTGRELDALAQWCADYDVRFISDEIYHGITYPTENGAEGSESRSGSDGGDSAQVAQANGQPAREMGQATAARHVGTGAIVVNSFSKYWAMTGWRLGWLLLPRDLIAPADALAGNVSLCPPALSQYAGIAAFSERGYAAARQDAMRYRASRQVVLSALERLGWTRVAPADGAFYVYANISGSGLDSRTWCARLLDEAGVAMTPGSDFDSVAGDEWVRLSFASDEASVAEAMERTITWQRSL